MPIRLQVKYLRSIFRRVHQLDRQSVLQTYALRERPTRTYQETAPLWMSTHLHRLHPFHRCQHIPLYRLHSSPYQLRAMTDLRLQPLLIVLANSHPEVSHLLHPITPKFAGNIMPESHSLIRRTKLRLIV